jgi:predicted amidohydrolase
MKIAVCQLSPNVGEKQENLSLAREAIVSCASAGAKIIVLPELANTGYEVAFRFTNTQLRTQHFGQVLVSGLR